MSNDPLVHMSDYVLQEFVPIYRKLYVLDVRTGQETLIADFEAVQSPRWSPVSDIIAFSAGTSEEMNVYLIKSDGTGIEQLTSGGFYSVGTWSPDGRRLALTAFGDDLAASEVYVLDIETKALEQVTQNDAFDGYPIWVELDE